MAYKFQRGAATASGSFTAEQGLTSNNALSVTAGTSTLQAVTATTISGSGTLQAGGLATLNGGVNSTNISGSGTLQAGGSATIGNGLTVAFGGAIITGSVAVNGSITSTGNISVTAGVLSASNAVQTAGNVVALGGAVRGQTLTASVGSTLAATIVTTITGSGAATFASLTVDSVDINGGTIDDSNITVGSGKTLNVSAGTLTLADGVTLSTGIFSSSNSNTRSIQFGSAGAGNIQLTHTTAATTVLDMATITGFTYTGPGGFTVPAMSNTRTFSSGSTAGGTTTNAPRLTFTTGASVATITSGSYFNKLDFGTTSFTIAATTVNINSLTLSSTGTFTALIVSIRGTGTLTYNGGTTAAVSLFAGSPTIADNVTCTTFTVNGGTFNFISGTLKPTTS
jgi:hypothetical protein